MTLRQIHKYEIICDGEHPRGGACGCSTTIEAHNEQEATDQAISYGWTTSGSLGLRWLCNARDGHRGDKP